MRSNVTLMAKLTNCIVPIGLLAAVAGGCSSTDEGSMHEATGSASSDLFPGTPSSTHPEIVTYDIAVGVAVTRCSAVLVAPTLAMTALSCLVKSTNVGTNALGGGAVCQALGERYDVSQLTVHVGGTQGVTSGASRGVAQIITAGQTNTCQGDIAFMVLDTPVTGVTFPLLQLDTNPNTNDPVTACGWGHTDSQCTNPNTLNCSTGTVIIPNGGYYAADQDTFPAGNGLVTNSTCYDDAGGGVYDSSGAVYGIISSFYNPDKTKTNTLENLCGFCDGSVSQTVLLNAQVPFIARAFESVGLSPTRAGHPTPAAVGGTCTQDLDCNSQLCVGVGSTDYCSEDCSSTACPSSTVCTTFGDRSVCLPEVVPHPASCVAAASTTEHGGTTFTLVTGIAVLGAVLRRRRRNRSEGKQR